MSASCPWQIQGPSEQHPAHLVISGRVFIIVHKHCFYHVPVHCTAQLSQHATVLCLRCNITQYWVGTFTARWRWRLQVCMQQLWFVPLWLYPAKQCSSAHNHHQSCHCITFAKPALSCLLYFFIPSLYYAVFNLENFLLERDYITFGSLQSQIHLSSVCNVHAPCSGGWNFWAIFLCHFVLNHRLISVQNSQGNPFVGDVKCKKGNKIERCRVRVSHLLMSFLYLLTRIYVLL